MAEEKDLAHRGIIVRLMLAILLPAIAQSPVPYAYPLLPIPIPDQSD